MKLKTAIVVLVEQRPGFPGYVAGLLKGRKKETLLNRLFKKFTARENIFVVLPDKVKAAPYIKSAAVKFGAAVVAESALPAALDSAGFKVVAVLSQNNDIFSPGLLEGMIAKLSSEGLDHVFFKPVFGIPYNVAELHVARTEFLRKTGLRRLREARGFYGEYAAENHGGNSGDECGMNNDLNSIRRNFGRKSAEVYYELELADKRWLFGEVARQVSPYPRIVAIEPTNLCNLKCTMCPVHASRVKEKPRASGMMEFGLFKKIIRQLPRKRDVNLVLHGYGEPLLHPKLVEMVSYAKKAGVADVQFATNGMLLTREKSKALIAAGLDRLDVSLDGFSKKIFEKIRAGAKFNTVTENIRQFILLKGKRKKPALNIRLVRQKQNDRSVGRFIKYWLKRADTVTVDECHDEGSLKKVCRNRFPCPALRLLMEIYWDGTVVLCNMDAFGKNKLGNLKKESLLALWNGKRINAVRKNHERLNFVSPGICKKCGWWQCFDTWTSCKTGGLTCLKNPVTAIWKKDCKINET
ncbi:MAG: radical SAM protein [Candidatus Firestonebacteria bacterium]